ncbi:MAG: bifunctional riboflavin kinase/FAD synthetase [Deltaproteobacteria bacterium]|nr:bifunctional riboflavin kinase/FAD synthetase [Deltaproteobacteria bacterium]
MEIFKSPKDISSEFRDAYVTIGNFDGIHVGHRYIFNQIITEARSVNAKAVVITFEPHPKMVLHPERRPFYLIATLEEKMALLEEIGIDAVFLIPFSLDYAQTTARAFICDVLWQHFRVKKVFIGHDYTFGRGKEGNQELLEKFGKDLGFEVTVIDAVKVGDRIISSTLVRNLILAGEVKEAADCLGRPYNLGGTVVRGHQRGGDIGFPTANLEPEKVLIPRTGVYAAVVLLQDVRYAAVLNIGYNPTFGDSEMTIEIHLLDFDGDIYGKALQVYFIDRLRDELRFPSAEELVRQIRQDIAIGKTLLKPYLSGGEKDDLPLPFGRQKQQREGGVIKIL